MEKIAILSIVLAFIITCRITDKNENSANYIVNIIGGALVSSIFIFLILSVFAEIAKML